MALSLADIHEHLRTDAGREDAIIRRYAAAAVSAAERTTGRKLRPGDAIDTFENPAGRQAFRLSAQPTGIVVARAYVGADVTNYPVEVNGQTATLPVVMAHCVTRLELVYRVGPECDDPNLVADADPEIELGVLQFVAYAWTHRGDNPNSWGHDSGAIGLWQPFRSMVW